MQEVYILAPRWAVEKYGISTEGKRKIGDCCLLWRKNFPNETGKYIYELAELVQGVPISQSEIENILKGRKALPKLKTEADKDVVDVPFEEEENEDREPENTEEVINEKEEPTKEEVKKEQTSNK